MHVLSFLKVQIQTAKAATLAFAPAWDADLAHTAEARNHGAAVGLLVKLGLNGPQQFVRSVASKLVQRRVKGWDSMNSTV